MSDTVNYADAVKRCEELHDDNRQDLKLLSLEIARLKDELSKTEGYPGIVHDLERARVDLSAAVRERDEARAECERLRDRFAHMHVNNGQDDSCKQCGLDLRNPIHAARRAG